MNTHLKYFKTHDEYNTYISGQNKVLPNVSYCEDQDEVHFNPSTFLRIATKFNVTDPNDTYIAGLEDGSGINVFEKIIADGQEIDLEQLNQDGGHYAFGSTGEHSVIYTYKQKTQIPQGAHAYNEKMTKYNSQTNGELIIPNGIKKVCEDAFLNAKGFNTIVIPSTVEELEASAFRGITNLNAVTIYAPVPPVAEFDDSTHVPFTKGNYPIYVPVASINAYKAAWSYYADQIQAIAE